MGKLEEEWGEWYASFEGIIAPRGSNYINFSNELVGPFQVILRMGTRGWQYIVIGVGKGRYASTGTADLQRAQKIVALMFLRQVTVWSQERTRVPMVNPESL